MSHGDDLMAWQLRVAGLLAVAGPARARDRAAFSPRALSPETPSATWTKELEKLDKESGGI